MARPSDSGSVDLTRHADVIDSATFDQILEMDDDDQKEFSKSIVYDFFTQAQNTFDSMDTALEDAKLAEIGSLGHFLKGSSATLGLTQVKDSCEKIQNLGAKKDTTGHHDEAEAECLKQLKPIIEEAKTQFTEVESLLKRYYNDPS